MPLEKIHKTKEELQDLFNRYYLHQYERGDLTKVVTWRGRPDPANNQLPDTKSEIWELYNNRGDYIARVHAYVRADGTLSASGKPDPKELIIGQKRYVIRGIPKK